MCTIFIPTTLAFAFFLSSLSDSLGLSPPRSPGFSLIPLSPPRNLPHYPLPPPLISLLMASSPATENSGSNEKRLLLCVHQMPGPPLPLSLSPSTHTPPIVSVAWTQQPPPRPPPALAGVACGAASPFRGEARDQQAHVLLSSSAGGSIRQGAGNPLHQHRRVGQTQGR